jgi:F-type H+-transporting ATPase subunit gamma
MAGGNSTQDIKRRVRSVTSIEHITNAMKLVSAAKLRHARNTFEKTREYFHFVTESIEDIFHNTKDVPTRYLKSSDETKNRCYVIVTSNRGLAGSFNTNVIKRAEYEIQYHSTKPHLVAIGGKGRDWFMRRGYEIEAEYLTPPENISFLETKEISKPIIELFDTGKVDEIALIYTSFVTALEQRVRHVRLLPFELHRDLEALPFEKQVEYEPSAEAVFNYLVPKYVEIMIYGAIVESATCEHAARRMAMENATDNAQSMIAELNLSFNRARQAAITREITEIVSGADALG